MKQNVSESAENNAFAQIQKYFSDSSTQTKTKIILDSSTGTKELFLDSSTPNKKLKLFLDSLSQTKQKKMMWWWYFFRFHRPKQKKKKTKKKKKKNIFFFEIPQPKQKKITVFSDSSDREQDNYFLSDKKYFEIALPKQVVLSKKTLENHIVTVVYLFGCFISVKVCHVHHVFVGIFCPDQLISSTKMCNVHMICCRFVRSVVSSAKVWHVNE